MPKRRRTRLTRPVTQAAAAMRGIGVKNSSQSGIPVVVAGRMTGTTLARQTIVTISSWICSTLTSNRDPNQDPKAATLFVMTSGTVSTIMSGTTITPRAEKRVMMHEGIAASAKIVAGKCGNGHLQSCQQFCSSCSPPSSFRSNTKPFYTLHYRNCKDVVGNDHEQGKDDVCLDYLGGWDRSCNSYYDCWNSRLKGECEDCADNGNKLGCDAKYNDCNSSCMNDSPALFTRDCQEECDVCFCESGNSEAAINECQAIGNVCCNDPLGQFISLPLLFPRLPSRTFF